MELKYRNKIVELLLIGALLFVCTVSAQNHTEYYDNGNVSAEGFKDDAGISYGRWTYYRKDGSINAKINFDENGIPKGAFTLYYRKGQIQTRSSYSGKGFYEMEGEYEDFYKNGQLNSKGRYKANKPVGKWITYWENGKVQSKEVFTEEGVIQQLTQYHKNGQLRMDVKYNAVGDFMGDVIIYYENGKVFQEKHFDEQGNKIGLHQSFYPNGNLMEVGKYAGTDYFTKTGTWKTYYISGQLRQEIEYDNNGKIVNKTFYDEKNNTMNEKQNIIERIKAFTEKADALENQAFNDSSYQENGFVKDFNVLFDEYAYGKQNRTLSGLNFRQPPRYDNLKYAIKTESEQLSKTRYQVTFWAESKFKSLRFIVDKKLGEWRIIRFETFVGISNQTKTKGEEIWRKHKL